MGSAARWMNQVFDKLVRREIHCRGRSIRLFQVCGLSGFAVACMLGTVLAMRLGVSLWILSGLTAAAIAVFVVLAFSTKVVLGCETLIYYHHEIAIFAVCGAIPFAAHLPVFAYLDIMAVGVGSVLAGGRVGCLMAACCHGRPHSWGVRYQRFYVRDGFCERLVGVRLFPVQLVEFAGVAALVAVCFFLAYDGYPSGTAFFVYVLAYAPMRFGLEFLRGDPDRRYWLFFSEAQWTSCVVAVVVLARYTAWAYALPLVMMATGFILQRVAEQRLLFRATHILELAAALERSRLASDTPNVAATSLGVRISTGRIRDSGVSLVNYSISRATRTLSERNAHALCRTIALLDGANGRFRRWVSGSGGVYHLVIGNQK